MVTYGAVWRSHFYAGLFCIPFFLWLAVTGSIYLFKPQIDAALDRTYDARVVSGPVASPSRQARAALAAEPGSTLTGFQLPRDANATTQVLVTRGDVTYRAYVAPQTARVLGVVRDDERFTNRIFHLHGELLLGDRGSFLIELAASWGIVMICTGLYLWWPRDGRGLAGIAFPRMQRGRIMWRDLHAVTGFWVSAFTLFLLISGLPWAASWGNLLATVRSVAANAIVHQPWPTGSSMADMPGMASAPTDPRDPAALDRILPVAMRLDLMAPIVIAPPSKDDLHWTVRSDTQNRPLRASYDVATDGTIGKRSGFGDQEPVDRIVAVGIAAHEGQLFTPINQILSLFTTLGLIVVTISALVMWRSRRPGRALGAPKPLGKPRYAPLVIAGIAALGFVFPFFGISLIVVTIVERFILRRIGPVRVFLGLTPASAHVD